MKICTCLCVCVLCLFRVYLRLSRASIVPLRASHRLVKAAKKEEKTSAEQASATQTLLGALTQLQLWPGAGASSSQPAQPAPPLPASQQKLRALLEAPSCSLLAIKDAEADEVVVLLSHVLCWVLQAQQGNHHSSCGFRGVS